MKIIISHSYYSNGGYFVYVKEAGIRHIFDVYKILRFDNLPTKDEVLAKAKVEILKGRRDETLTKTLQEVLR